MKGFLIVSIVEGHGEVQALPILLRRIHAMSRRADVPLQVNPPIRVKAGRFFNNPEDRRKHCELAALKAAQCTGKAMVLLLFDCEDECPAERGQTLREQWLTIRRDVPVLVALAHREYETWFIAASKSLQGHRRMPLELAPPEKPERRRDAKGWLSDHLGRPYNEPADQPAFTQIFDFEAASTIPSFSRLHRRLLEFFGGGG